MYLKIALTLCVLISSKSLYSQVALKKVDNRARFYISAFSTAGFDDFSLGTAMGALSPSKKFAFYATFEARPYRRAYQKYLGNNLFYQLREERFMIGLGSEYLRSFPGKKNGIFAQLNGNYTWGKWGGTEDEPGEGFVLTPRAGFFIQVGRGILKMGYSYQDVKSDDISPHRAYFSITGFSKVDAN